MPKVRLLVPVGDDAAGAVIDVDDETFAHLRADGKASAIEDEEAAAEAAKEGNFNARTGREDTPSGKGQGDEDAPPPKGKK